MHAASVCSLSFFLPFFFSSGKTYQACLADIVSPGPANNFALVVVAEAELLLIAEMSAEIFRGRQTSVETTETRTNNSGGLYHVHVCVLQPYITNLLKFG